MKLLKISSLLFFLPLLISCQTSKTNEQEKKVVMEQPEIKTIFDNISIQEFKNTPPDPDVVILDVRTDEEVAEGKIDNAIQINFYSEDFKEQLAALDSTKTYVVYCRTGGRSSEAARVMTEELGFKKVQNLDGGYQAYSKDN